MICLPLLQTNFEIFRQRNPSGYRGLPSYISGFSHHTQIHHRNREVIGIGAHPLFSSLMRYVYDNETRTKYGVVLDTDNATNMTITRRCRPWRRIGNCERKSFSWDCSTLADHDLPISFPMPSDLVGRFGAAAPVITTCSLPSSHPWHVFHSACRTDQRGIAKLPLDSARLTANTSPSDRRVVYCPCVTISRSMIS